LYRNNICSTANTCPCLHKIQGILRALLAAPLEAKQLFEDLVKRCQQDGIIDGSHVAIDSSAIHAYEKKQPKRKSEQTGNANWGAKLDSFVGSDTSSIWPLIRKARIQYHAFKPPVS